jgi:hypothetical protein
LKTSDFEEMVAVVLVEGELGSVGRFAGRKGAGDFHGKNRSGAAQWSLTCDFPWSKPFARELPPG